MLAFPHCTRIPSRNVLEHEGFSLVHIFFRIQPIMAGEDSRAAHAMTKRKQKEEASTPLPFSHFPLIPPELTAHGTMLLTFGMYFSH